MIMFARCVLLLVSLLYSVSALPLASRDVVDPPITNPTAGTIWHVGQKYPVTWKTAGLPVNQSNPSGMLVLGYVYNNSENLMLNSPLATNINYSTGQFEITVPGVPTRSDYIVVLFGDSGNASPEFTIINDGSSSSSVAPSPTTASLSTSPPAAGSTPTTPVSSISPAPNNDGDSSPSSVAGSTNPGSGSIATVPLSQTLTSHFSTVVTATASSTSSSTQSNAAWQKHAPCLRTSFGVALALSYFAFS